MKTTASAGLECTHDISLNGRFRYALTRRWGAGPVVAWLMLNPSTADAERDDPTLRRIMDWADAWGYHGVSVVNVYPYRTSKPAELWRWLGADHESAEREHTTQINCAKINQAAKQAALRMVGFGADVANVDRLTLADALTAFGEGVMCMGTNQHGWPLHPMARGKHRIPSYIAPTFWAAPTPHPEHSHV